MSLAKKYPNEVKQILSKYPPEHKRSAVMPLLYLAQREEGYLTKAAMKDVARIVDISDTDVGKLLGCQVQALGWVMALASSARALAAQYGKSMPAQMFIFPANLEDLIFISQFK